MLPQSVLAGIQSSRMIASVHALNGDETELREGGPRQFSREITPGATGVGKPLFRKEKQ